MEDYSNINEMIAVQFTALFTSEQSPYMRLNLNLRIGMSKELLFFPSIEKNRTKFTVSSCCLFVVHASSTLNGRLVRTFFAVGECPRFRGTAFVNKF
jgi:hypothetical protein